MTVVVLTTADGSPWTVPGDWNNADNRVICIAGGGGGQSGGTGAGSGGGGGGGSATAGAIALTAGGTAQFQVGPLPLVAATHGSTVLRSIPQVREPKADLRGSAHSGARAVSIVAVQERSNQVVRAEQATPPSSLRVAAALVLLTLPEVGLSPDSKVGTATRLLLMLMLTAVAVAQRAAVLLLAQ